jgi:hypothetical protein
MGRRELNPCDSGDRQEADSGEQANQPSGSIKFREFIE